MTEKLYWKDAYIREFEAEVVNIENDCLELDKTAFYPGGGGLVSDRGYINDFIVKDVFVKEGKILHKVDGEFRVGEKVFCVLDWERRYRIMRMHTATHLISSLINKKTGALITGNKVEPDVSRIDFNLETFNRETVLEVIEEANEIVKRDAKVNIYFLPYEEAMKIEGIVKLAKAFPPKLENLRIVEIEGIDIQADGGVHVKSLKEVGEIRIEKMENKGRNNRRLYFSLYQ